MAGLAAGLVASSTLGFLSSSDGVVDSVVKMIYYMTGSTRKILSRYPQGLLQVTPRGVPKGALGARPGNNSRLSGNPAKCQIYSATVRNINTLY